MTSAQNVSKVWYIVVRHNFTIRGSQNLMWCSSDRWFILIFIIHILTCIEKREKLVGGERQFDTSFVVSHELPTFILFSPAHNSKMCTTASNSFHDNWSLLDFKTETTCQSNKASALLIRQMPHSFRNKKAPTSAVSPKYHICDALAQFLFL